MADTTRKETRAVSNPNPDSRILAARIAAATRWGTCPDRTAATQPARDGLRAKFAREVDPHGTMPAAEREYRVEQLHRAHMLRMAIASKKARATRAGTGTNDKSPSTEIEGVNGDGPTS